MRYVVYVDRAITYGKLIHSGIDYLSRLIIAYISFPLPDLKHVCISTTIYYMTKSPFAQNRTPIMHTT